MNAPDWTPAAAGDTSRRLFVFNGGFLTQGRIRRILTLAGYDIRLGKPGPDDLIGVWGQSPTSGRGEAVAERTSAAMIRVEDGFLRSVLPGRSGEPPLGLLIDDLGVHFDPQTPSRLERILREDPLDDAALLARAKEGIARLRRHHLSKYNGHDPALPVPAPGYVLVVDQTAGDASVRASRADRNRFLEMLFCAREDHPHARIVIKTHPETQAGHRPGHFTAADGDCLDGPLSPWHLLEGAIAVYTVSSQLGFEAILAGHRPVVFGQPFYAGWGLTDDRMPIDRRQRRLTKAQLFAAAMIKYPVWYDPYRDRLCSFETAMDTLEAEVRAYREDHQGWVAAGMRLWKRPFVQRAFGQHRPVIFDDTQPTKRAAQTGRKVMAWGTSTAGPDVTRVEDGFIRSRGLGAALVPPLSLILDRSGIYFDPSRPSDLEGMIAQSDRLGHAERARAERVIALLTQHGLSKYNTGQSDPLPHPDRTCILVPGQVEDDASIRLGTTEVRTNAALLAAARAANPDAVILYKPHPDVEAGLRPGQIAATEADIVLDHTDPIRALSAVDAVWTMTSTLGFEALIRGKSVTCLGAPFYAGWGLTTDLGPVPDRRMARPDLIALVHACLIDYPRYFDPVTGRPCPVEVILDRLIRDEIPRPARRLRLLSKAQGLLAGYAHLWR